MRGGGSIVYSCVSESEDVMVTPDLSCRERGLLKSILLTKIREAQQAAKKEIHKRDPRSQIQQGSDRETQQWAFYPGLLSHL
ncbi:unnamed protein product [Victoria cruziana]